MVFVRSLLYNIFGFGSVLIAASILILTFWAPYSFRYRICVAWCRLAIWGADFFCGIKTVVEGEENIPDTPSVILIKHTSTMETLWQVTCFPRTAWVLKREILRAPFFGWAIGLALQPIAINRQGGASAMKQVVKQGKQKLAEGTRMAPGKTRKYGSSGAALAKEAGVPIVPVAHNAGDCWGRRSFNKRPGVVRFVIGPSIDPGGRTPQETNLVVQDWIESRMHEISRVYREQADR